MADILKPDLCIIGAGALGLFAATEARRRGAAVVLVDRGPEAGDAPQGHLHRAAIAASAARVQAIRTAGRVGLEPVDPRPSFRQIAENAQAVAQALSPRDTPDRLASLGITRIEGTPHFTDRRTMVIDDTTIRAGHVLLATGAAPLVPDVPGLGEISYLTPLTILDSVRKLTHLVVIGGTEDALVLAQSYRRLGSAVTLVPQGQLPGRYDQEALTLLLRLLREDGVVIDEKTAVAQIQPRSQGIGIVLGDGGGLLDASHVLLAMGPSPQSEPWLEKARLGPLPFHGGRAANRAVSAAGVLAGEPQPHAAQGQVMAILDQILGGTSVIPSVPLVMETDPPLAQVGLTAGGKLPAGASVLRHSLFEGEAARSLGESAGALQVVVDKTGQILGGAMVGRDADSVVALLALLMARRSRLADLAALRLPQSVPAQALVALAQEAALSKPRPGAGGRLRALRRLLP